MSETLGLSPPADAVYRALLRRPESSRPELSRRCGLTTSQTRAALTQLEKAGFVRRTESGLRPERPDIATAARFAQREQDLLAEQERMLAARREVNDLVERFVAGALVQENAHDVERIEGLAPVAAEVDHQFSLMPREVRGIQRKLYTAAELDEMLPGEIAKLHTGFVSRIIVPSATLTDPASLRSARILAQHGEQARAMPVTPMSLMIFDDRVALVPLDPADSRRGALAVRNRSLVLAMTALFELAWEQARPLFAVDTSPGRELPARDVELLNLLQLGLQDQAIARQLGLGVRTVRRDVARLLSTLGARSRFEAGVLAVRRGWL
jgi:DNA-binding MarR family transcriptional regulator/DNA-binding CsgD family transcriptional regulator